MDNVICVVDKSPFDKERMPSTLQFKIRIAAVCRRDVGVKEERLVFRVKHVDGLFKCRREVNHFTFSIQMKNAVDKIRHDIWLFEHLAKCRTITGMQIFRPFKTFGNYDIHVFHIAQNSEKQKNI